MGWIEVNLSYRTQLWRDPDLSRAAAWHISVKDGERIFLCVSGCRLAEILLKPWCVPLAEILLKPWCVPAEFLLQSCYYLLMSG